MGLLDWILGSKPAPEPAPEFRPIRLEHTSGSVEPIHLARGQGYNVEVVGEAHRQDELDSICGGKCEEGHTLKVRAQLILVDGNVYDPNAVGVFVDCKLVGYIPRDVAPYLRAELPRISPDQRPVTCDAVIVGGWDRGDGDHGHYGIRLSLSQPLKAAG